jgi:hypothetical protein
VVTVCTAQWSLYVPPTGHCMYRTVVAICTYSGHYMYRTVVTVCIAQWSLYVPHSGHYIYHTVVTVCTTRFVIIHSSRPVGFCVLCGSQNNRRLFPHPALNDCVYCAVRTECLNAVQVNLSS